MPRAAMSDVGVLVTCLKQHVTVRQSRADPGQRRRKKFRLTTCSGLC
jgi:hypothetical protein